MFLWQRKRKSLTAKEQAERIQSLQAEANERSRRINTQMDRKIAEMEQSKRDIDDMRNGGWPGGFDDSAGKARVC